MMQIPTPENIVEAARNQGLSMNQLYRKAGVNKTTFWRWQTGKGTITVNRLQALLDALEE